MNGREDRVAAAYIEACLAELDAPKPGNVHRFAPGHAWRSRTSFAAPRRAPPRSRQEARASEPASAPPSTRPCRRSVRTPISASSSCARRSRRPRRARGCRACARRWRGVLDRLDRADAADVFSAIAAANPGGLGRAPRHDVQRPCRPRRCARPWRRRRIGTASRDNTSRLMTTFSRSACRRWRRRAERQSDPRWSTLAVYLTFLAAIPDTHIARKFDCGDRRGGPSRGGRTGATRSRRLAIRRQSPTSLLSWDAALKSRGINPGTSADLTVATLICVESLRHPRRQMRRRHLALAR